MQEIPEVRVLDDLLEPFCGHVTDTRNATELSRLCEGLVRTFVRNDADKASVSVHLTAYDIDTLYKGLWGTCAKARYRGVVRVHKQDGMLILIRERRRGKRS